LGYSKEDLSNMNVIELHPPWMHKEAQSIVAEMLAYERTHCPLPLIGKSGKLIPAETRVSFGRWSGKNCIYGISKDLSKEQEALQKFDRLFRMNPAPMALSSLPERKILEVNNAFLKFSGYTAEEVLGKTSKELGLFTDENAVLSAARMLDEYGRFHDMELRVRIKDGTIREGIFFGDLIENQGEKYLLTVMTDITERKKIAAEREKLILELQCAIGEIKTLRGIVPICASCKKIRDDSGYWEQVEAYVSRHTEARFSHGICPECMKKFYSDFMPEQEKTD